MKRYVALLLALSLSGCGLAVPMVERTGKLEQLSLGETREQALDTLGSPYKVRAAKMTGDSKAQVDEYHLYPWTQVPKQFVFGIFTLGILWFIPAKDYDTVWVYYLDGKLTQWGAPGDLQKADTFRLTFGDAVAP